jgi:hypothetical protein
VANKEEWIDDNQMAEERWQLASGRVTIVQDKGLDTPTRHGMSVIEWLQRRGDEGILHKDPLRCAKTYCTLIGSLSFSYLYI